MRRAAGDGASRTLSIRLSPAERRALEQAAGAMSLGAYIRSRVLDGEPSRAIRRNGRSATLDHEALGRVLGMLGASGIARSLRELAGAVRSGSLPVTPDTESAIRAACTDIARMRALLLRALGPFPEDGP